jgi:Ca-activated chloride channel homolog
MSFSWPWALLALLAVPLLLVARWWLNRRRKRNAITVSSVALIRTALPGRTSWRRRIPVYLFLIGLLALAGALARPQATVAVPSNNTSILLAIDVSSSMCSSDVAPNRLTAASEAARNFINKQHDGTRIGLVAFGGIAGLLVPPTTDKNKLLEAIDNLKTARGTAIGQAILTSIDAIAEVDPSVAKSVIEGNGTLEPDPVPSGAYAPDIIVVLTDGVSNAGPEPVEAAQQASNRGVRVYTIGFGTANPDDDPRRCPQSLVGNEPFTGFGGGFGGGGGGFRRGIDEDTLTAVANATGGKYFPAESAKDLEQVFASLPTSLITKTEPQEISAGFVGVGVIFAAAALLLGRAWRPIP